MPRSNNNYYDREWSRGTRRNCIWSNYREKIGDKLNFGYNHSKHAGKNDHTVPIDAKFEARQIIDRTLSNYDALSGIIEYDLPGLALAPSFYRELIKDSRFEENK